MAKRTALARFLVLPENRSALLACRELLFALTAGEEAACPLYLHGPAGSGKSHLVQTLEDELLVYGCTVCRLSARDLAESTAGTRDADLLIVEDLQHLPGHDVAKLIALLDERSQQGSAMVFTALHGPANLMHRGTAFPPRLRTRLAECLVIALAPLQCPSRRRVLEAFAEEAGVNVAAAVLDWLAEHLTGGGRQLEGAIAQLNSLQKLQAKPLRLSDIRAHFAAQIDAQAPTVQRITEHVGEYYSVEPRQLMSARRVRAVMLPRQISMYLARQLTRLSLARIGKYFGGRDHKTVQHACRKVEAAMKSDAALSGAVNQMHAELT